MEASVKLNPRLIRRVLSGLSSKSVSIAANETISKCAHVAMHTDIRVRIIACWKTKPLDQKTLVKL